MRHKSFLITAILLALILSLGLSGCGKKSADKTKLGLSKGGAAPQSKSSSVDATGGPEALGNSGKLVPASGEPTSSTGENGSTSGSTGGSDGSGSTGGSTGSTSGGSGSAPAKPKGFEVKVLWWNDTASKAPDGCEIVFGSDSFKPDTAKNAAAGAVGPVPFNKVVNLVVYPDGRGGKKIVVPFEVETTMLANSDRDAIHVEISDTRVRVLGNPVDGFDRTFDRF